MESISLAISTALICGIYGALWFKPSHVLELTSRELYAIVFSGMALMYVAWAGFTVFMLAPIVSMMLVFYWLPVQFYTMKGTPRLAPNGLAFRIDRVVGMSVWPKKQELRCFARGKFFGIVPYSYMLKNLNYWFNGDCYTDLNTLIAQYPQHASFFEHALIDETSRIVDVEDIYK